jgi:tetratricopeptide (TPR) repeat protein
VAPRDQAPLLDGLLPEDAAVAAAFERQQKAFVLGGPSAGRPIAAEIRQQFPQHPGARLMSAMQAEEDGRTGEALAGYQELSNEIPDSASVRRRLLSACRALGNAALMRKTLRDVVERGVLPGVRSQQEWDYPPDRHVCHYADLLRFSAETRQQAAALLHGVLKRNGNCGEAWHNLGDLLWDERDFPDALLAYRLGSLNAVDNEHYARAYCDALAGQSRENEGLAWLEQRVRESGASQRAVAVWPTWIGALEDYGHPERALAACQEALERHGHAAELLGFAVPFLARMGHWERAEDTLRRLEACGNAAVFHESATYFHSMRGDLEDAVRHAEAAVREQPGAMPARKTLLELRSRRDGAPAAVQEAARWSAEQPGHDELEEIYYFQLEWGSATAKKYEVLRRRVKRDPEDGWAWAALAYACAYYYQFAGERRQRRIEKRIAPFLAECDRTAPDDSATRRVYAQWLEARCEWPAAVAAWLRAVERDPGDAYRYRRTWDCAASLDGARRLEVWERLEAMMLRRPGRLALAPDMAPLLAQRFGVDFAEQAVSRWLAARPEDPEVRLAAANLLLDYGHGRSDAARALEMLKPAVEHFPYHFDLRLALARAHRALRQHAEAEEVLGEALRRHPANSTALIQMIWVHERGGKKEDADRLLALAMARDPYNADVWNARAEVLLERGRHEDVRAVVAEGLRRSPESVYWRERSMNLLIQCGDSDEAVRVAREGVRVHPRGAYLWLLLGRTLSRWRRHAAPGEIERCLRRGLELNRSLFDAADWLACLLVEQSRYDDAAQVMREILPRLDDPCTARGRLAWIARQQGRKTEAIDEMAAVLQAAPWYSWGWSRLIEWIEEDKEWERARSLLGELPGPMRTVLSFRVQRLKALDKAGRDAAAVDAEWNELLRDFPGDESLRLDRYDLLREAKREAEAAEALDAIVREFPESPFVQARWAAALFAQGRHEPALEAALRVWFAPVEESTWPVDKVWAAAHEAERHKELYARARARLERGEQPTARAWVTMASHAATIADPWWWRFFAHASYLARETTALLRMLDRAAWDGRAGRAALLAQMNEDRRYATLVRYWKKRRAVVEADTPCWVEVGRALLALGRRRAARKLLASWPARPGVMMWMVANYVLTLPRTPRGFRDARAACRGALAALPHDHCARCLAYILAESCAALGDTTGLLETWNTYRAYFQRATEKGEWFDPKRANLHHDVPALVGFLEEKKRWRYRAKVLRIWVGDLRQG